MDGAALIQMPRPSTDVLTNFEDYLQTYVIPYAVKKSAQYDVLHFVFDVYLENSLKDSTREKRGSGNRIKVALQTPLPTNWQKCLHEGSNKTQLFNLVADHLKCISPYTAEVYATKENTFVSNITRDLSSISPCSQDEADTRLLLHASTCNGVTVIKTVDTDVITIAIGLFLIYL